jgi:hypothetical protein
MSFFGHARNYYKYLEQINFIIKISFKGFDLFSKRSQNIALVFRRMSILNPDI